jgi:O-acetyl-ADP-ribose deacetylase (regulator of RNase III)
VELTLIDCDAALCNELRIRFKEFPDVKIINDYLQNIKEYYSCIVSPANSYGMMDGGFDKVIINHLGHQVMENVQNIIVNEFYGIQPVGTSFIMETGHGQFPYIAHTPTMVTPSDISETSNVYFAMLSMLIAVKKHNEVNSKYERIREILCPGFGTGTGKLTPQKAARQMYFAYYNFLNPTKSINWNYIEYHQSMLK